MSRFKRILWATDFSECSNEARAVAVELTQLYQAELHALHVIHNLDLEVPTFAFGLDFPGYLESLPRRRQELSATAREALAKEFDADFKSKHHTTFAIQFGVPFHAIADYAQDNAIDLIVLGTHGRTGVPHVLLGSVAERVVQQAGCPVLTIPRPRKT